MEPEILYEDEELLAINKPAGLVVHSDGKTSQLTLVDWLLSKYPKIRDVGESGKDSQGKVILRSGIVHRLDKDTSGVMLVAKTQKAFDVLKKQFKNREVQKIYHAFVVGILKSDEDTIDRSIGRSAKDFRMWSAQRGARGEMREAVTDYKVISRGKDYTFVEISPKTGRTHQIRVHFKAINHCLVADSLYASKAENSLGFSRLALHSYQVTFKDVKGDIHKVTAPYPEDFVHAVSLLQSLK